MKKVLTLIVSYNFEPWINRCIPSLLDSTYPTDIMVIDNASGDNTVAVLREQYPSVIIVESKENLGFGKANNIGMEYAISHDYDYLFLVNQDAWLEKDCISNLLHPESPQGALLSPMHYDGTEQHLDKGFAEYCKHISFDKDVHQVDFVNAAFWWIPIDIIKRIGSFSPIFYHYGEDKDFGNRLKFHHIPIYIIKKAKAYHDRQDRIAPSINFKSEFVYHLTEFCNINYSWSEAFSKAILAVYKKAAKQLLKGNWAAASNYMQIASNLWNKVSEVKATRKKNKILSSYFNLKVCEI